MLINNEEKKMKNFINKIINIIEDLKPVKAKEIYNILDEANK